MSGGGALVIIGGHEDRDPAGERVILREIARRVGAGRLVLATIASGAPEGYVEEYRAAFADLGIGELVPFHVTTREEAVAAGCLSAFDGATGVFFSGGDQRRITETIVGTPVEDRVREILDGGGVIAGTSAGASAMSGRMIERGPSRESPAEGEVRFVRGLNLLPGVVVDQHFAERGRIGRLMAAVSDSPAGIGLGIDEDTAVVVEGSAFVVLGAGGVTVVDGGQCRPSNSGVGREVVTIIGATVHLLGDGDRFNLRTRALL